MEKSLIINSPKTTPLKSDKRTFREYIAKMIATKEGSSERAESSIE